MPETPEPTSTSRVGSDLLVRRGERIILLSRDGMPDWEVRKFRRFLVRIEGLPYRLVERGIGEDGRHRYVLEPWPREDSDPPAGEIAYDAAYVLARDEARRAAFRRELWRPLSIILLPAIGFLPSDVQARLHERYGYDPRTATERSVTVEVAVILMLGALLVISSFTGIFPMPALIAGILVAAVDVIFRYNALLEERMDPPGFYEWLFRRKYRSRPGGRLPGSPERR